MLKANNITWYNSNDIRKVVEQDSNFGYDLWYYWTQSGYEITSGTIAKVHFGQLLEELNDNDEHGLACNLLNLMNEIDPDNNGVYIGYFW